MMDRMYDLSWEVEGDIIRLEQDSGCGEASAIDLHTCQLRLLAEQTGLLSSVPTVEWPRGFKTRLLRLHTDIGYLADEVWLGEICERMTDGLAYRIGITAALDTINDLLLDTGIQPDTSRPENVSTPPSGPLEGRSSVAIDEASPTASKDVCEPSGRLCSD